MGKLTTHVLDTAHGRPGAGITVELYVLDGDARRALKTVVTNHDGRCDAPLLQDDAFVAGEYELVFHAGDYFAAQWIDRSCHRSAYSYQFRAALQLALEGSSAVTFLDYACSGAQVNAGLFQPFQGPEFTSTKAALPPDRQAQLSLLLGELCQNYEGGEVRRQALSTADEMTAIVPFGDTRSPRISIARSGLNALVTMTRTNSSIPSTAEPVTASAPGAVAVHTCSI